MSVDGFDELTNSDIDRLVQGSEFDVERRDALQLDFTAKTPLQESSLRPRTVKAVNQYLETNELSTVRVENVLGEALGTQHPDTAIPSQPKVEMNCFLKAAVKSDNISVEKVNGSKFDLKIDEKQMDRLVDLARFNYIDRCLSTLEGDGGQYSKADRITHYNGQISNNKWQELYSKNSVIGDIYPYREDDFAAFNLQVDDEEMAKSFIQYHLAINNLKEEEDRYVIKACPEEIDISADAIEYAQDMRARMSY